MVVERGTYTAAVIATLFDSTQRVGNISERERERESCMIKLTHTSCVVIHASVHFSYCYDPDTT